MSQGIKKQNKGKQKKQAISLDVVPHTTIEVKCPCGYRFYLRNLEPNQRPRLCKDCGKYTYELIVHAGKGNWDVIRHDNLGGKLFVKSACILIGQS